MTEGSQPGFFVILDGMAGAGKTTTVRLLGAHLRDLGYRVHTTAEPTRDHLGELARRQTDRYRGRALACLIAADRYHHIETEIRPRLRRGQIVLCDRYVPSSYVLQQIDGVPLGFLEALNGGADRPDLAVILLTAPEVAAARIAGRGAHDRFQSGVDASRTEARMYRETAANLQRQGQPVLTIDTTRREPRTVVQLIAERIAERITSNALHHGEREAGA